MILLSISSKFNDKLLMSVVNRRCTVAALRGPTSWTVGPRCGWYIDHPELSFNHLILEGPEIFKFRIRELLVLGKFTGKDLGKNSSCFYSTEISHENLIRTRNSLFRVETPDLVILPQVCCSDS